MMITLTLDRDLEDRLTKAASEQSLPVDKLAIQILEQHFPPTQRAAELKALFQSWDKEDGSAEQSGDSFDLLQAIDEDRMSPRKLFPSEMRGVTW